MSIFKNKNKKQEVDATGEILKTDMIIKVLGSGCSACKKLEKNTVEALKLLSIHAQVEHVTDFSQIASYGVMSTPALVVDEKVVSYGKVLKTDQIQEILKAHI